MTGPQLDLDEQIVDADWARDAVGEWFKAAANIRQMHSPNLPPAGKGIEIKEDDDGFWLRSKIIEPYAIKAIENEVYTGYSIGIKGPRIQRDNSARGGRIVGGTIVETSIVDYPCLSSAKFVKSDERTQSAKFVLAERFRDDVAFIGKFAPVEEVEETRTKLISTSADIEEPVEELVTTDMPEEKKEVKPELELWYKVKRAHDALCPAYDLADVLFTYPELAKNGLAGAIGPGVRSQVFALLNHEVEEDGGSGDTADNIAGLATAYKSLCTFLYAEALNVEMEDTPPSFLMDARSELHKAFVAAHPDQVFRPKSASFTFPAVPGREGMPEGSESFSGGEMTSPGGSASFSPPSASFMLPSGSDSKDRGGPPANTDSGSTSVPAVPGSESGMPGGGLSRSSDSIPKLADLVAALHQSFGVIDAVECPALTAKAIEPEPEKEKILEAPEEKPEVESKTVASDPDVVRKVDLEELVQRTVKAATKAAEARHAESETELQNEIESLKAKIEELSKEPDPNKAVLRKAVGNERPSALNDVTEAQLIEKRAELKDQLAEWKNIYEGSPEFGTRDYARRQIERIEESEILRS